MHVGIRARWAAGGCAARYASGEAPKARLKEVVKEPTQQPYGVDAGFRDPSGNQMRVMQ